MPQNDELHVGSEPKQALPVEILQPTNVGVGEFEGEKSNTL